MRLSPREIDKLLLHQVGGVAQKRLARGIRLNYTESVGLIAAQLLEFVREGQSVADLMDLGKKFLGFSDVMPGVAEMIHEVQVEGTFPDGTKLITVHTPICSEAGDMSLALHGSGLDHAPSVEMDDNATVSSPGAFFLEDDAIELNAGRPAVTLEVLNTGDRPIQVGSHYPFFETNFALEFDRAGAYAKRLNIPAGTAVRFEPGETRTVELVPIAGEQIIYGGNAITSGLANDATRADALERYAEKTAGESS